MSVIPPPAGSSRDPDIGAEANGQADVGRFPVEPSSPESQAQVQLIIDSSPHAIFIKDLQGRYLQINAAFESCLRLSRQQIIGHTNEEILPADLAASFQAQDLQALVNPRGVAVEVTTGDQEGGRAYQVHKFPLRNRFERIHAVLGYVTDITARRRAEEALRVSEEKFRQLAENISEVFWITDLAKNQMQYISPAYETIWGRTCDSLLQSPKSWLEAIHPDDRQRVADAVPSRQIRGDYDEIYRIVRPDGSVRWIHDRAFPVRNARGEVYRLVGIAADITEFRRIQDELAGREEKYREVFGAITEGLIIREWDQTIVEVNPAFCRLLGYSRDEALGLKPEDFIAPDSLPLFTAYVDALRGGHAFRFEGQYVRKDGTFFSVDVSGTRVIYGGRPHLLAAIRDISAQKDAQDALRKSEAEFRIVFENAPIGIALVGANGQPIRANRALIQQLGYSEQELKAMVFTEFTHPDDIEADLALYRELMDGKREHYQIEKRYLRKGGGLVNTRLTVSMVRGPTTAAKYAIAMVEDITEKKKLEEQFLRAQRLESVGMLASGIAHDLNNILAPMLMAAGFLKEKLTEPRDQGILAMIEQGAQRGAAVIRQLLTFSRGAGGVRTHVQARHLIDDLVHLMQETFPRNIEIRREVPADLWTVIADATQLHQVLLNLCVNARDAMPKGGRLSLTAANVRLSEEQAKLGPQARAGRYVELTVADTGHGIPKEIIDRVFDPFFTTKKEGQGTGLGLATVLAIAKSHDGFVTVDSEEGKGTAFRVCFPAAEAQESDQPETPLEAPGGRGELVLVVDDELHIRETVRKALEDHHYRVLTAANGQEAIQLFLQHRFELKLVLTDVMMPLMGGVEMIGAMRVLDRETKIIAMSGLEEPSRQGELEVLGVTETLAKPCPSAVLLQSVYRALAGS